MTKKRMIFLTLIMALLLLVSISGTLAYWKVEQPSVNVITTAQIKGEIICDYELVDGEKVSPGQTVGHVVNIKNTGNRNAILRVEVDKFWTQKEGTGELLSGDVITFEPNQKYWKYHNGWYYYKGILAPDETTLEPLMNEFTLNPNLPKEYANQEAKIKLHMECLQTLGGAIKSWGISYSDLGIEEPQEVYTGTSNVAFLGDAFSIDAEGNDLFSAFKDALPGVEYNQKINISNEYENEVEIFLSVQYVDQDHNEEELEKVNELLEKHAYINIENGEHIYSGPVWNKEELENNEISLGKFAPGEQKELSVSLLIDGEIGNEFQQLLGKVQWVLSAQGDIPEVTDPNEPSEPEEPNNDEIVAGASLLGGNPKTGDYIGIFLYFLTLIIAGAFICCLFNYHKKYRKRSI